MQRREKVVQLERNFCSKLVKFYFPARAVGSARMDLATGSLWFHVSLQAYMGVAFNESRV